MTEISPSDDNKTKGELYFLTTATDEFSIKSDIDGLALKCYEFKQTTDKPTKAHILMIHGIGDYSGWAWSEGTECGYEDSWTHMLNDNGIYIYIYVCVCVCVWCVCVWLYLYICVKISSSGFCYKIS